MSNEKIVNINAANNAVPLHWDDHPALIKKIGKTTYKVTIHFSLAEKP